MKGWDRTFLLAAGAGAGVLATAAFMHFCKKSPEEPPRGWDRTIILGLGALGGTIATALLLHRQQYA